MIEDSPEMLAFVESLGELVQWVQTDAEKEPSDAATMATTDNKVADLVKAWKAACRKEGFKQRGRRRMPVTAEKVQRMHRDGYGESVAEIAFKCGVSRNTVYKLLKG